MATAKPDIDVVKRELTSVCADVLTEKNLPVFGDMYVHVDPEIEGLMAYISMDNRRIHILANDTLPETLKETLEQEKIDMGYDEAIRTHLYFVVSHEHGHHEYAPRTKELFEDICVGIYEAIEKKEARAEMIMALTAYIQNMFTDTIINSVHSHVDPERERFSQGFNLHYLTMGRMTKKKYKKRCDKATTLFLKTNHLLSQTDQEMFSKMGKLIMPYALFPALPRYTRNILDIMLQNEKLVEHVEQYSVTRKMEKDVSERLLDTERWRQKAHDYALVIYPLIKQRYGWMSNSFTRREPSPQSEYGQPKESKKNKQSGKPKDKQKGQGDEKKEQQQGSGGDKEKKGEGGGGKDKKKDKKEKGGGNEKDKQNDDTDNKKKEQKQYYDGRSCSRDSPMDEVAKKILFGGTKHIPFSSRYLKDYDRLNLYYRGLAGRIKIITEEKERLAPNYAVFASREEMDREEFSIKDIDWSSTRYVKKEDGTNHVELYKKICPITIDVPADNNQPGCIPDISFIFDSSVSMEFSPHKQEGDYHFAVLAFYSILNELEDIGIAPLLNYHIINFSYSTLSSGWHPYSEIEVIKKTLFDYQGGGTILNVKELRNLRKSRRDNFLSFMLTDYDFNFELNSHAVTKEIINMVNSGGVGFMLFKMTGGMYDYTPKYVKKLEQNRVPIINVDSAEDFMNRSFKFTKDLYGEFVK